MTFRHLRQVCRLIDADNGVSHVARVAPELVSPFDRRVSEALAGVTVQQATDWDRFVAGLKPKDLETIAAGEEKAQARVLKRAPPGLDEFLTRFFEAA